MASGLGAFTVTLNGESLWADRRCAPFAPLEKEFQKVLEGSFFRGKNSVAQYVDGRKPSLHGDFSECRKNI